MPRPASHDARVRGTTCTVPVSHIITAHTLIPHSATIQSRSITSQEASYTIYRIIQYNEGIIRDNNNIEKSTHEPNLNPSRAPSPP